MLRTWRVLLWDPATPGDTRIGVDELKEALGVSRDWIYQRTGKKTAKARNKTPLPCRRLDGEGLIFVVEEVREWVRQTEEVVHPGLPAARTAGTGTRLRATRGRG